ncbi:MAG: ribonuclease P protein component [Pseudomonadota bacterium]|nr:ribonuclease P protein component [Pseudomonadota bacterium]
MSDPGSLPIAPDVDNTLGRQKKMRKTDEFSSVFRFRCVRAMPGLDLLSAPNGLDYPRLGMIVPKKIIATAVGRNRIKRVIREVFRLNQAELVGLDVVARIRSKSAEVGLEEALQLGLKQCKSCVASRVKSTVQAVNSSRP